MSDVNMDLGSTSRVGRGGGVGGWVLPGIYVTEAELKESKGFGKAEKRAEESQKLGSIMQHLLEGMWICIYLSEICRPGRQTCTVASDADVSAVDFILNRSGTAADTGPRYP